MEALEPSVAERVEGQAKLEKAFWLVAGVVSVATVYYLTVKRFQLLDVEPTYTTLPDPYLSLAAVVLIIVFAYRQRSLLMARGQEGMAKGLVVLLVVSALAITSAGLVREVAYRLPGVRILLNSELYHTVLADQLIRSMNKYCWGGSYDGSCSDDARRLVAAHMDVIDAEMSGRFIKGNIWRYLFVEGLALLAMVAAFVGLNRLVMSGSLGRSSYYYVRLLNRYGAKP